MGQKFKKMGIRASHTAEVILDDVRVPGSCLLGGKEKLDARLARAREGQSTRVQAAMSTFEASRPLVGAQALGIARAAYEYSLDYAKERKAFGRPIIENQAIAFKLADMKMEIDAARLLVWRACWMARNGKQFVAGEGSMSKLKAGEVAVWATEQAIQILGGYGYVRDYPVEKWHRDSKIYTIFEGTSEIQRLVIARAISGIHIPPAPPPPRSTIREGEGRRVLFGGWGGVPGSSLLRRWGAVGGGSWRTGRFGEQSCLAGVWPIARIEDDHVSGLAGAEQVWTAGGWHERCKLPFDPSATGYGFSSDEVAAVRVDPPDILLSYHDEVHAHAVRYLERVDAAELDRVVDTSWDPPVTAGVRIVSVISDMLQHAGQAAYVRGLIERQ